LELQLKANEVRLASLERQIDALRKNAPDTGLPKRIWSLENSCETLEARLAKTEGRK
jgi:hypothetical protein